MSETIVIRVNESADHSGMSFSEWLDRGRKWWKTRADRVLNADRLVVLDIGHRVMAVGTVVGVLKDVPNGSGRVSIEVHPEPGSDLLGKRIRRNSSRNPVGYVREIEVID